LIGLKSQIIIYLQIAIDTTQKSKGKRNAGLHAADFLKDFLQKGPLMSPSLFLGYTSNKIFLSKASLLWEGQPFHHGVC